MELGVWQCCAGLGDLALGEVVADDVQIEFGQIVNDVARTASKVRDGPTPRCGQFGESREPVPGVGVRWSTTTRRHDSEAEGLLFHRISPGVIRLVASWQTSDADVDQAVAGFAAVLAA